MKIFRRLTGFASLILCLLAVGCSSSVQATYPSADDAVNALVSAARAHDHEEITRIFGEDLSSGDDVIDRNNVDKFVNAYDQRHALVDAEDGSKTLVIGKSDWPLPIPLVNDDTGIWRFDTDAGKEEILNRRIGRNEIDAIKVCLAVSDAQFEYARLTLKASGLPEYAQKFVSDPGKKNGLFWDTAPGEKLSPLGPAAAAAAAEGYTRSTTGKPVPYHGYYYRILTAQSPSAPGGAYEYIVHGKMIGGFALVASPAEYDNSGVMTFIISHSGDVYEKDLGEKTDSIVKSMKTFDPGEGWNKVDLKSIKD